MPSYVESVGIISGSSQTVSNTYDAKTKDGLWTFIPSIPAGSTGTMYVSWKTMNYTTPRNSAITTDLTALSGGLEFARSSATVTADASAQ